MAGAGNAQQATPRLREIFSAKRADHLRKEEENATPFAAILDAADLLFQAAATQTFSDRRTAWAAQEIRQFVAERTLALATGVALNPPSSFRLRKGKLPPFNAETPPARRIVRSSSQRKLLASPCQDYYLRQETTRTGHSPRTGHPFPPCE